MLKLDQFIPVTVLFFKKFQSGSCLGWLKLPYFTTLLKIFSVADFVVVSKAEFVSDSVVKYFIDSFASTTTVWLHWPVSPDHALRKYLHSLKISL